MSVLDAVRESRLRGLEALRAGLAAQIDAGAGGTLAQVAAQLRTVLAEIDELAPPSVTDAPATGLSEFERRLHERESGAKVPRRATGG